MNDEMVINSTSNKENWTDKDWSKFKTWLKGLLKSAPVTITFTKKDGSTRVMNCSLEESKIPKIVINEDKPARKLPRDLIVVYDLDINQWRSFKIQQISKIEAQLL